MGTWATPGQLPRGWQSQMGCPDVPSWCRLSGELVWTVRRLGSVTGLSAALGEPLAPRDVNPLSVRSPRGLRAP